MIVSNTTPISVFLRIERVDLLAALFGPLTIPQAVADELDRGAHRLGHWRAKLLSVEIRDVPREPLLALLTGELDRGEAEAIALAAHAHCELLLIDDGAGREAAARLGIPYLGSAGIILLAKERKLISTARPLLEDLRQRGGLWLSDRLVAALLRSTGED